MPNWCDCDLLINGSQESLSVFEKVANTVEQVLDQNVFIPYPEKFHRLDEIAKKWDNTMFPNKNRADRPADGFNNGGYEWCLENWGTKWGICRPTKEKIHGTLVYHFETAWEPPLPIIIKMGSEFPDLTFELKYFEQGMGFQGIFMIQDGMINTDERKKYDGDRGG